MKALRSSSYIEYFKDLSEKHHERTLSIQPDSKLQTLFAEEALKSIKTQSQIEEDGPNFHQYLKDFLGQ